MELNKNSWCIRWISLWSCLLELYTVVSPFCFIILWCILFRVLLLNWWEYRRGCFDRLLIGLCFLIVLGLVSEYCLVRQMELEYSVDRILRHRGEKAQVWWAHRGRRHWLSRRATLFMNWNWPDPARAPAQKPRHVWCFCIFVSPFASFITQGIQSKLDQVDSFCTDLHSCISSPCNIPKAGKSWSTRDSALTLPFHHLHCELLASISFSSSPDFLGNGLDLL